MSGPAVTVLLPTYHEAANIGPVLEALRQAFHGASAEFLVVDDDSTDGTADAARQAGARVVVRKGARGLATAVVRGIQEAQGTYVVVMDADFQHPPQAARALLEKALATDADLVVGSRYTHGGSEGRFSLPRRIVSGGAALAARICLPPVRRHRLTDPMSGLFLVRRDRVDPDALRPRGYKVLLEILAKCPMERVQEVGYTFGARRHGQSKLGALVIAQYLLHLLALGWRHPENQRIVRFGIVGGTGIIVNLGLLYLLHGRFGLHDLIAVPIAVEASIITNFLLNDRFTFRDRRRGHKMARLARFNAVSLVALAINVIAYTILTRALGLHYLAAQMVAVLVAFTANYMGNLHWTYGAIGRVRLRDLARRNLAWLPFLLVVLAASGAILHDVDRPAGIYFDEHHYVTVAYQFHNDVWEDPCWEHDANLPRRPPNWEHPPLAKLLMAWSVARLDPGREVFEGCRDPESDAYAAFTDGLRDADARAWRLPSALFGIATVVFAGLAAGRLFGGPLPAALAALFVASDGVVFTSSRIAMLDIFAAAFVVAALYAATFPTRRGLALSALLLALGFLCKYPAAFAGPGVLAVALWSHHRAGRLTRRRTIGTAAAYPLAALALWPVSYAPWWRIWVPDMGVAGAAAHWLRLLRESISWGLGAEGTHPHASPPWAWFGLVRPVWYHVRYDAGGPGVHEYIYGVGNPVVWWAAAAAAIAVWGAWVVAWARHGAYSGFWRAQGTTRQALLVATLVPLCSYLGFLVQTRLSFLFYMTLVVPTLAVLLAGACAWLWRQHGIVGRAAVAVIALLAIAAFAYYYPVLAAVPITPESLQTIMGTVPWTGT